MRGTVRSSRNGENRLICLAFCSVLTSNRGSRVMKAHPDIEITVDILRKVFRATATDSPKRPDIPTKYHTNMNGVRTPPLLQRDAQDSRQTECTNCAKMFACNPCSRAGLTSSIPDTADTASRSTLRSAVREKMSFVLFRTLMYNLPQCAELARQETSYLCSQPVHLRSRRTARAGRWQRHNREV